MKKILDHHEVYYVYSKIWVDDFCSWTQSYARFVQSYRHILTVAEWFISQSDEMLKELGELVAKATVTKSSIGWDLEALEAATLEAINREADSDDE
jgi:protein SHQ1